MLILESEQFTWVKRWSLEHGIYAYIGATCKDCILSEIIYEKSHTYEIDNM